MEEDRLYWDSRKQFGVRVDEANGKKYVSCFLDWDAWIDSRIGEGEIAVEVSSPSARNDELERLLKELESGRQMADTLREWYIDRIFYELDAWNHLLDEESFISV